MVAEKTAASEVVLGSVVQLKSGSTPMSVGKIGDPGVECWYCGGDGDLRVRVVPIDALMLADDTKHKFKHGDKHV